VAVGLVLTQYAGDHFDRARSIGSDRDARAQTQGANVLSVLDNLEGQFWLALRQIMPRCRDLRVERAVLRDPAALLRSERISVILAPQVPQPLHRAGIVAELFKDRGARGTSALSVTAFVPYVRFVDGQVHAARAALPDQAELIEHDL